MNQFKVNNLVRTSKSLLINDEIVSTAAMRLAHDGTSPVLGACATRNNQVWNEELVLTNIMKNNHRNPVKVGRAGESGRLPAEMSFEDYVFDTKQKWCVE